MRRSRAFAIVDYIRLGRIRAQIDLGDLEEVIAVVAFAQPQRRLAGDIMVVSADKAEAGGRREADR